MTLSKRNLFFKIGIAFAALSLVLAAASISLTSSAYAPLMQESAGRSRGILQFILTRFVEPHAYVPYVSMLISSLYSCITIIIVYYFFEKTQAPEILFFFLFVLSFSFEGARSMLPLVRSLNMPNLYAIIATRILIFSRYFGLLSLFFASIYAAGLEIQKMGTIIFIIAVVSLTIALGVPVDGLSWDSSFAMISGYPAMFALVEAGIVLASAASFCIAAYSKGSRDYVFIALGSFLVFLGKNILVNGDTWPAIPLALGLLISGTWFICSHLHRFYLWL